jgi:hypothetical protein
MKIRRSITITFHACGKKLPSVNLGQRMLRFREASVHEFVRRNEFFKTGGLVPQLSHKRLMLFLWKSVDCGSVKQCKRMESKERFVKVRDKKRPRPKGLGRVCGERQVKGFCATLSRRSEFRRSQLSCPLASFLPTGYRITT